MMGDGRQLFIYWRVATGDKDAALKIAREVQAELRLEHPGLQAMLYESENASSGPTLMETYVITGGIDAGLQAMIDGRMAAAMAPMTLGGRHVEVFVPR